LSIWLSLVGAAHLETKVLVVVRVVFALELACQ
jgi:hypothetical protein